MNFSTLPSSMELEPCPSSLSYQWPLPVEDPPVILSWPSLPLPSLASPLVSPQRGLWAWLRWGLFALLGLGLGLTGEISDHLALHGKLILAADVFPWNRYIRTRPGYEVGMHGGDIAIVERALASDPYSADLTYGLGAMYHIAGDEAKAQAYAQRFIALAPRSPLIIKGPAK